MQRRLSPGAPGTIKYVKEYGDRLVCVRYKYNENAGVKTKTIELVVSEEKWTKKKNYIPPNKNVYLKIPHTNIFLQKLVREAGGVWDMKTGCLRLSYAMVKSLGLEHQIDWSINN